MLSELARDTRRQRALRLLDALGISHRADFSPLTISGGERQRVAIARALANNPEIIIADEPTGNLDLKSTEEVMGILKELNEEGRTIIMVTHNPEITKHCNRVIRMRDGKIRSNHHEMYIHIDLYTDDSHMRRRLYLPHAREHPIKRRSSCPHARR